MEEVEKKNKRSAIMPSLTRNQQKIQDVVYLTMYELTGLRKKEIFLLYTILFRGISFCTYINETFFVDMIWSSYHMDPLGSCGDNGFGEPNRM